MANTSWASFQSGVNDYRKMLDELEAAKAEYDLGAIKSWDLDAAVTRLKPLISAKGQWLAEAEMYLWTRTGCLETRKEWKDRTAGWDTDRFESEWKAYYSRPRRRERARQEREEERIKLERKAAREAQMELA